MSQAASHPSTVTSLFRGNALPGVSPSSIFSHGMRTDLVQVCCHPRATHRVLSDEAPACYWLVVQKQSADNELESSD